jgi:hypothetical protein
MEEGYGRQIRGLERIGRAGLCRYPSKPTGREWGMPHTTFRKVMNTSPCVLISGCRYCDLPRGVLWGFEECGASLAGGWDARRHARPHPGTKHLVFRDYVIPWGIRLYVK